MPKPQPTNSLAELANVHGTDKGTLPSDIWQANNYTDIYEAYLYSLRAAPINLLEIGLGVDGERWSFPVHLMQGKGGTGGASLRMWQDYFPSAQIFGIDVNPAAHLNSDRICTAIVDQGSRAELKGFVESLGDVTFDVIVDDGSHRPDHQQVSLSTLFPHLRSGGLYFIEDLMDNGKGDPNMGRFSADNVTNTRKVLRSLVDSGEFAEPNSLFDTTELAASIEWMHFHLPEIRTGPPSRPEASADRSRARSAPDLPAYHFLEGKEILCVVCKRGTDDNAGTRE